MGVKLVNAKTIIVLLFITALILVLFVFGLNAKSRLILRENENLSSQLSTLNDRILAVSGKLQETISQVEKQQAELEGTRNKLTQERLKNTQLQEQIEGLKASASSVPEEPGS